MKRFVLLCSLVSAFALQSAEGSGQAEEDIVAGKLMAADVVTLKPANTVEGRPVKIMENGRTVMINNATATKADILCD